MKNFTLVFMCFILTCFQAHSLPKLSSLPTAQCTIFLDFDGQTVVSGAWNSGNPIYCAPTLFNDAQITEVYNRVSEDFRPFNINITTDSTVFLAAGLTKRMRIIVTPTSGWFTGVGGVSYIGSFSWGDNTPGFVFPDRLGPNNPKMVAECCSHESGHTVGLSHQSKWSGTCSLITPYNDGAGTGEIGWAPIMGNSYYKNYTGWNNGLTEGGCTSSEDNLSIIVSGNGFTYRADDHSNDPAVNPTIINIPAQSFSAQGIITTTADKDAFKFVLAQNGNVHIDAKPFSIGANDDGANLDVKIVLLDALKQPIGTYDPPTLLSATADITLNAGAYYIVVSGTSNANASQYGSLGSYTISGTYSPIGVTPIRDVALTGKIDKNNHNLNWNIISDEPIKKLDVETSTDGRNFTTLTGVASSAKNFIYNPFSNTDIFYRLKVTSVIDQTVYSNVITLKTNGKVEKQFKVSTIVHDEVMINAGENYQYQLSDISGRIIAKGQNNSGISKININANPNGMYVMQIISTNQRITERIIKQ